MQLASIQIQEKQLEYSGEKITLNWLESKAVQLNDLTKISLFDCILEDNQALPSLLSRSSQLSELNLSGTKLTTSLMKSLASAISQHPHIHTLIIRGCKLNQVTLSSLGSVLSRLKIIDLGSNNLRAADITNLFSESGVGELEYFGLKNNQIGPDGSKALASAIHSGLKIKELDVSFNSIKPQGVEHLASALAANGSTQKLHLRSNDLEKDGTWHMIEMLSTHPDTSLTFIDLSINRIKANELHELAEVLATLPQLTIQAKGNGAKKIDIDLYKVESHDRLLF